VATLTPVCKRRVAWAVDSTVSNLILIPRVHFIENSFDDPFIKPF
jgi:hypothetical protein